MRHSKMTNPANSTVCLRRGKLASLLIILGLSALNTFALGEANYVETNSVPDSFALCDGTVATILVDINDWPGVARAAGDLATDIHRVTGKLPRILNQSESAGKNVVIIGTIEKSKFIDAMIRDKKLMSRTPLENGNLSFSKSCRIPFPALKTRW